jgi:hypothetical protein
MLQTTVILRRGVSKDETVGIEMEEVKNLK